MSNNGIAVLVSAGAPTSGTSGTGATQAGKGTLLIDVTNGNLYMNTNTAASPTWTNIGSNSFALTSGQILVGNASNVATPVTPSGDVTISNAGVTTIGANAVTTGKIATGLVQQVTGSITSANITGTGAGQLGSTNGVVIVAAPGANLALELIDFGLYYTFATAAYTGGGNITLNWGAGGAAITGLISYANSVGAAANKGIYFVPLAAAATPIVGNQSINLVSAAAPTQPGTAAGTIAWECRYRILNQGF